MPYGAKNDGCASSTELTTNMPSDEAHRREDELPAPRGAEGRWALGEVFGAAVAEHEAGSRELQEPQC